MLKPNVSYCEDNNEVHYNPWVDPKLVCKYNVTDISSPTQLRVNYESNVFKSMEIDGVQLDNLVTEYTFGSTGVHTVKYELYDETKLGNNAPAFYGIASLISVSIPDSVTSIGNNVLQNCTGLTSVTIPDSVTSIGVGAFTHCPSLTSVSIPNSVTSIGSSAFSVCEGLTSVTIPSSVTSIDGNAFSGCDGLVTITVDSNNSTYDSRNNCNAIIETATNTLIAGCKNTVIPNSVTSIGNKAFSSCKSLTSVTIPSSVTSIGFVAFSYCGGLTTITAEATTAPTIQNDTFENIKANGTLTVPSGSSGYNVWMSTGSYYLGKYNWTKVEQ